MYSITVVGTGYVGLVTGACLADFGNRVTCVDTDTGKIESLRALELPFFEPGLPDLVARNVQEGRLCFDSDLVAALDGAQVVFITVGTPPRRDGMIQNVHACEHPYTTGTFAITGVSPCVDRCRTLWIGWSSGASICPTRGIVNSASGPSHSPSISPSAAASGLP